MTMGLYRNRERDGFSEVDADGTERDGFSEVDADGFLRERLVDYIP
jgi:hypothetical protein